MTSSNQWPGGKRHAMYYSEHEAWNASHYPGTRQLCKNCDCPTGRCEEDEIFTKSGEGPLCEDCWHQMQQSQGIARSVADVQG